MRASRLILMAGLPLALLTAPGAAEAQPTVKTPRIGVLGVTAFAASLEEPFKRGLGDLGYTEGRNVVIEQRHADGKPEELSRLAADLARLDMDLILVRGAGALSAAKQATSRIPIVAVDLESDPVARGFVQKLARPGGNITGVFLDLPELSAKQLQLLKEVIQPVPRVAILGDPLLNGPQFQATERAARALGIQPQLLEVRAAADFRRALDAARAGRASAILLLSSPLVFTGRTDISTLAMERRLPAVSMFVEFAEAGGLMAYGPSLREAFHRAGTYAGRILQGAKPGELPVERPTTFEWIINLKTARILGLTVPSSVQARADRVIQ